MWALNPKSARLVCAAQPQVAALPHVAHKISALIFQLGAMEWTLERASKHAFVRLLPHLLSREWPGFDQDCREKRLYKAVDQSIHHGYDVRVLEWCLRYYMLGQEAVSMADVLRFGIWYSQLPALNWLHQRVQGVLPHLERSVSCYNLKTVIWLHEHGGRHLRDVRLCLPLDDWSDADFQLMMRCLPFEDEATSSDSTRAVQLSMKRSHAATSHRSSGWLSTGHTSSRGAT